MDSISSDVRRFEDEFALLLERRGKIPAHQDPMDRYWFVHVPADRPPWKHTGIEVVAGDRLSVLRGPGVDQETSSGLGRSVFCALAADRRTRRDVQDSQRFAHFHRWAFSAPLSQQCVSGAMGGCVWADGQRRRIRRVGRRRIYRSGHPLASDAAQGLRELAQRTGPAARFAEEELQRLRNPVVVPEGWRYLPSLGDAGVFSRIDTPGAAVIRCQCDNDAMILQRSLEAPFTPDTRLRWSWKVESLPSARAEDSLATHDYLSLAVEFDNGQDLSYLWSAALEPERSFRCPVASWRQRETHIVIRSGHEGLGRWIDEERDLWRDYQNAIGSPPARISPSG